MPDDTTTWKTAYQAEFVRFALTRNWDTENATVWSDEIAEDARLWGAETNGGCPIRTAQADVVECEMEATDAG